MEVTDIKKIAVVGAGVIGNSWTANFIWKGYPVNLWLFTAEEEAIAKQEIQEHLEILALNGVFGKEDILDMLKLVTYTTSLETAVKDVQLIQESIIENVEIKQKLLAHIDKIAKPDAIFASSTSSLLISDIAKFSQKSQRCIGAHPFNPPHLIPLVEITIPEGEKGSSKTAELAAKFYEKIDKVPIILKKDVSGFVANQIQGVVSTLCGELLAEGICTVEDIEKAMSFGPGLRWAAMGPYLVYQLGGGKGGIKGLMLHIGAASLDSTDNEAMEEYKNYANFLQGEVDRIMAKRPSEFGNDNESLRKFRDRLIIKILRERKKI
ncbi:MAG: 3-hydroxyacyl-CoA dehydrogenase family protein [Promethearchaeota archaeon]|jgi:3-hydroxyacyl-CoA dehydrogenase